MFMRCTLGRVQEWRCFLSCSCHLLGLWWKNPAVLTSFVTLTRQLGQEILYTQNEWNTNIQAKGPELAASVTVICASGCLPHLRPWGLVCLSIEIPTFTPKKKADENQRIQDLQEIFLNPGFLQACLLRPLPGCCCFEAATAGSCVTPAHCKTPETPLLPPEGLWGLCLSCFSFLLPHTQG